MGPYRRSLEVIQVKDPCPKGWDKMEGDGPMRFCGHCEQNVYDLSALTSAEAEELIALFEGSMCVRMRQRVDGTLISADCTDRRRRAQRRRVLKMMAAGVASVGLVAATFGAAQAASEPDPAAPCPTAGSTRISMGEMERVGGLAEVEEHVRYRHPSEGSWIDPEDLPRLSEGPPAPPMATNLDVVREASGEE